MVAVLAFASDGAVSGPVAMPLRPAPMSQYFSCLADHGAGTAAPLYTATLYWPAGSTRPPTAQEIQPLPAPPDHEGDAFPPYSCWVPISQIPHSVASWPTPGGEYNQTPTT